MNQLSVFLSDVLSHILSSPLLIICLSVSSFSWFYHYYCCSRSRRFSIFDRLSDFISDFRESIAAKRQISNQIEIVDTLEREQAYASIHSSFVSWHKKLQEELVDSDKKYFGGDDF